MIGRVIEFTMFKPVVPKPAEFRVTGTVLAFAWHDGCELYFAIEVHHPEMPGSIAVVDAERCRFVQTEQQHRESWDTFVRERLAKRELA